MTYEAEGFLAWRELEDGRLLAVASLTFGRARLTIGPGGEDYYGGYSDGW